MSLQSLTLKTQPEAMTEAEIAAYEYRVYTATVDTSVITIETKSVADAADDKAEAETDELLEAIAEIEKETAALFPHQKNPDSAFNPYSAVITTSTRCEIDDEYLLRNIHAMIDMDYSAINWKPREITPISQIKQVLFDIETTGLDPEVDSVIMIGVRLKGDFLDMPERYKKYESAARVGLIFTINNPEWDRETRLKFGYQERKMPDTGDTYGVFVCKSESDMLRTSLNFVSDLNSTIIPMHNGLDFDAPFIARRCQINNVPSPITVVKATTPSGDYRPLFNTAATSAKGTSIAFDQAYWTVPNARGKIWNDGSFPQIIDTIHLSGQENKLRSNMDSQSLKCLARDYIGGRDSARRELTYPEMQRAWKTGDAFYWGEFLEYLVYDLQDQEILTDYFLPNIWEQQRFMPLAIQEIMVASPAKKWNSIMTEYYKPLEGRRLTTKYNGESVTRTYRRPQPDNKVLYEGALSKVAPGMYRSWFKVDVASLYPSILLRWKLFNQIKDPLALSLYILEQARELRYVYKKAGNKAVDAALKVLLNGNYGWLGTGGYGTNSLCTAALVTAYGRVMMRLMCAAAAPYAMMAEVDTDGCMLQQNYHTGSYDPECVTFTENLIRDLTDSLNGLEDGKKRDGIIVELQYQNELLIEMLDVERVAPRVIHSPAFVHHKMQSVLPKGIVLELEHNYTKGVIFARKAKNYISFFSPDAKPETKGIYRKRNRNVLQKKYLIEYVRIFAFNGAEAALDYRNGVINGIRRLSANLAAANGENVSSIEYLPSKINIDIDLNDVVFKQKISTADKRFQKSGMGIPGEVIYFYCGTLVEKWSKPSKDGTYKLKKVKPTDYFPVAVRMDIDTGKYELDLQDIPEDLDTEHLTLALNYHKYELGFATSCDEVSEVVAAGEARTSNEIELDVLKLPQWWHDENQRSETAWSAPIAA